jgi:hypothetical protein
MADNTDTQDLKAFLTEWSHWLDASRVRMRKLHITREQLDRILELLPEGRQGEAIGPGPDLQPTCAVVSGLLIHPALAS